VIDGINIHEQPIQLLKQQKLNPITSIMLGTNLDEGTLWSLARFPFFLSQKMYSSLLKDLFSHRAKDVSLFRSLTLIVVGFVLVVELIQLC
jgi:hypothetical protein